MYYWKTKNLASSIKKGEIDAVETKNYYIALSIITIIGMYLAIEGGTADGVATAIECFLMILMTVFGINITFNTNQGGEGVDYIARVVILSLPILIKLYVFSLIVGITIGIAIGVNGDMEIDFGQWPLVVIAIIVQAIYFWRLNTHLRFINT